MDVPGRLAKVALVSTMNALSRVSARPLPTATSRRSLARRLKIASSMKDQPAQPSFTPMATRRRSMSAMPAWSSTSICWMACRRSGPTGVSSIVSVKVTAGIGSPVRGRDAQDAPRLGDEIVRPQRAVGVADQPEELRILVDAKGDPVQPVALADHQRALGRPVGDESHPLEADHPPVGGGEGVSGDVLVAAALEEHEAFLREARARGSVRPRCRGGSAEPGIPC